MNSFRCLISFFFLIPFFRQSHIYQNVAISIESPQICMNSFRCLISFHFMYLFSLSQNLYSFSISNLFYVWYKFFCLIFFFLFSLFNFKFNTNFEIFFFTKISLYSVSMKMKTAKKCIYFFVFKLSFLILKMKIEYK